MSKQQRQRHELLLQFAPLLPDEVVWQARRWLAGEKWSPAVRLICQVFREWQDPLPADTRAVLVDGVDERTAELVNALPDSAEMPLLQWEFHDENDEVSEHYANIVRGYLAEQPGTHTAWQVWRRPDGAPLSTARILHLVETHDGPSPEMIAARLADRLWDEGLPAPQVEVLGPDSPWHPYYHAAALIEGREVFGAGPQPEIAVATFDESSEEREAVGGDRDAQLGYLKSGAPLTDEDELVPDLLTEDENPQVPTTLRTDGSWIWSDMHAHYLENHGIALPPEFRAHIAEAGPEARPPTRREWVAMVRLETAAQS